MDNDCHKVKECIMKDIVSCGGWNYSKISYKSCRRDKIIDNDGYMQSFKDKYGR